MSEKLIHIVFLVLNYLVSESAEEYKLLPIDKWILTILAKHHGAYGIFPNQSTIAREAKITLRYTKLRIKYLESIGLISINRMNRKNHYELSFLSTIGEPQNTYPAYKQIEIGEPQNTSQVNHRTPHRGTTVHTNNPIKNIFKKTERERKERAPLPNDFQVDQKTGELIKSLSFTKDEAFKIGIAFSEYFLDNGEARKDWQFEARKWFRRERKILDSQGKSKKLPAPVLPQRDTYGDRTDEPSGDPILAREFIKNIKKQFKSHGGLANGVLEKIRGDDEGG